MDLDLGVKRPVLRNTNGTSKSVSFAETIQAEVYPFLEVSPVSVTPIPLEIDKEFSSIFSESQANILPSHRSFDCDDNLVILCRAIIWKNIIQLTREEDKTEIKYLGIYHFANGTSMDPIQDFCCSRLARLRNKVRELQVFLGFHEFSTVLLFLDIRILLVHLTKPAQEGRSIFLGTRTRSLRLKGKLNGRADSLQDEKTIFLDAIKVISSESLTDNVLDLQVAIAEPRPSCFSS
ncbi:hypothetical protein BASA81_013353 [Batrachochytrium salamandrivorans]|nr:hypothetical protein BASA81_013353 [Batrachochytrium salamandrivorans]